MTLTQPCMVCGIQYRSDKRKEGETMIGPNERDDFWEGLTKIEGGSGRKTSMVRNDAVVGVWVDFDSGRGCWDCGGVGWVGGERVSR